MLVLLRYSIPIFIYEWCECQRQVVEIYHPLSMLAVLNNLIITLIQPIRTLHIPHYFKELLHIAMMGLKANLSHYRYLYNTYVHLHGPTIQNMILSPQSHNPT